MKDNEKDYRFRSDAADLARIWGQFLISFSLLETRFWRQNLSVKTRHGLGLFVPPYYLDDGLRRDIDLSDPVSRRLNRLTFADQSELDLASAVLTLSRHHSGEPPTVRLRRDEHLLRAAAVRRQKIRDTGRELFDNTAATIRLHLCR